MRLLEIVETFDSGDLGRGGDVGVGNGSGCMNEKRVQWIENKTYPFNPAATWAGSFSCRGSNSWRRFWAESLASLETFGLLIALILPSLSSEYER